MKKTFFYLCLCALFVSSCSETDSFVVQDDSPQLRSLGDGKFDVLGHGYDVTGKYIDGASTKALIIDVESLNKKNMVKPALYDETTYSHYSGTNIINFSKEISHGVGLTGLSFTGSLNYNFKGTYKFDSKKSYGFYSLEFLKKGYTLSATVSDLKSHLANNFKNHINSATPSEIVSIYGTHVMTDILLGARLEAFMETEATSTTDVKSITDAKLGFTFKNIFKVDVSFGYTQSLVNKTRDTKLYYKTVGGTAELETGQFIDVDGTTVTQPQLNMTKWSQSINSSTPRLIKVAPNSMIPIYELVENQTKKAQLKQYIEQYIKEREPISVNNYSPAGGVRSVSLPSHENQGAGVAIGDIDGNGVPDMIFMGIDNPKGANSYFYKILYDIDQYGNSSRESEIRTLSLHTHENQDGSIAIVDINKNGIPDIIFACADYTGGSSPIYYQIAFDVDHTGKPRSLSKVFTLPAMGYYYHGMGIAVYDFNKNGTPDLIYMVYDAPKGRNSIKYRIAYDLNQTGASTGGNSQIYTLDGFGDNADGAGIAVGDINKNGIPDIFITALDAPKGANKFRYKILWDVNSAGYSYNVPTTVEPAFTGMDFGWYGQGADCALYDLDRNGDLDLILMNIDNPKGQNSFRYATGFNFTKDGYIQKWR